MTRTAPFRPVLTGAILLAALMAAPDARAEGGTAHRNDDGTVSLTIPVTLTNGCLTLGEVRPGAAEHLPDFTNALPVTVDVRHNGADFCTQSISVTRADLTLPADPQAAYVVVIRHTTGGPAHTPERPDTARIFPIE